MVPTLNTVQKYGQTAITIIAQIVSEVTIIVHLTIIQLSVCCQSGLSSLMEAAGGGHLVVYSLAKFKSKFRE
jgi:hypothetical protein